MLDTTFGGTVGLWKMAKRQRTGNDPRVSKDCSTDTTDPSDLPGSMVTFNNPPNMNIVDISDTISDVEDYELPTDQSSTPTAKQRKEKKRRHKKSRKADDNTKHKIKLQMESTKESDRSSNKELYHKRPHHIKHKDNENA